MIRIHSSHIALTTLSALIFCPAAEAQGCIVMPSKSQEISVMMSSGVSAAVSISYYEGAEGIDPSGSCMAYAYLQLSSFPSSRVAARPRELASALREIAEDWAVDECTISISYDNDTSDEIEQRELCVSETFRFNKGDFWSSSSEKNCWEPDDV